MSKTKHHNALIPEMQALQQRNCQHTLEQLARRVKKQSGIVCCLSEGNMAASCE